MHIPLQFVMRELGGAVVFHLYIIFFIISIHILHFLSFVYVLAGRAPFHGEPNLLQLPRANPTLF